MTEVKVNEKSHRPICATCNICGGKLLLFVHKDFKKKRVTLGCGHCGHKNEIEVGKDEINMLTIRA